MQHNAWHDNGAEALVYVQNIESIKRTETLDAKEKALQAKEAELRRWEADLRATGGLKPKKNWPWLCPIVHHDIFAEVEQASGKSIALLLHKCLSWYW